MLIFYTSHLYKTKQKGRKKEQQVVVGRMPYRVSMADVDAYGVMYYSRFFEVFERARTELFRSVGIEYRQIFQQRQILMPVVEAACRYLAPAVYDDLLTVETAITGIGTRGMRFDYRIFRDDLPLAVGFTQHIFVDIQGRPVSFGKEIFQTLKDKGLIQGEFKDPEEEKEVSEEVKAEETEEKREN